ncbi:hypothetical protein INT45_011172 [Circinella minor]|uniref:M-phase phosphoprotein 6 n=1 Tax=Circinella minor TaxID=1195481 RepID=A0A8H7V9R0_9FUNG|nr:hypothetical protein INT45_011172 [Circinella minor]
MADKDKKDAGKKPSNRLLSMKFMQRSLEKEQQEQLEKERKRIITESEWVLEYESDEIQKPKIRVDYQPSFLAFTEPVNTGRQSFKEFNKKTEEAEKEAARRKEKEHQDRLDKASELEEQETLNEMQKRVDGATKKGRKRGRVAYLEQTRNKLNAAEDAKRPRQSDPKEQNFIKPQ